MPYARPRLDDFSGATDDAKLAAALASSICELQIDRPTRVTAPVIARSNLTIYGCGKFAADNVAAPVYLWQTTAGVDLIKTTTAVVGFYVRRLSMLGYAPAPSALGAASIGVNIVNGDDCAIESCLVRGFVDGGVNFTGAETVKCLSRDNRISAPSNASGGARGVGFFGGGNGNRSEYDYIGGCFGVAFESSSESAVCEQSIVEGADIAWRVTSGDCTISSGMQNAARIAIQQLTGAKVYNNFVRNAYPSNCQINDGPNFFANWNPA